MADLVFDVDLEDRFCACANCPLSVFDVWCLPIDRERTADESIGVAPSWCPLRHGHVIFRAKEKNDGHEETGR